NLRVELELGEHQVLRRGRAPRRGVGRAGVAGRIPDREPPRPPPARGGLCPPEGPPGRVPPRLRGTAPGTRPGRDRGSAAAGRTASGTGCRLRGCPRTYTVPAWPGR